MTDLLKALLLSALLLGSPEASAEEGTMRASEQAEARFNEGMALINQERWADAVEAFDASLALHQTQSAAFNRALCLRLLDRQAEAYNALSEVRRRYGLSMEPAQRTELDNQLAELRPLVGRLELRLVTTESSVSLVLDGQPLDRAPPGGVLAVMPGRHVIEAAAESGAQDQRAVTVSAGASTLVELEIGAPPISAPEPEVEPEPTPSPTPPPAEPAQRRGLVVAGWLLAGVALAALGSALGLALWNNTRYASWDRSIRDLDDDYGSPAPSQSAGQLWDQVQSANDLSESIDRVDAANWALMGLGVASTIASVLLLVVGRRERRGPQVSATIQPDGLALSLGWALGGETR